MKSLVFNNAEDMFPYGVFVFEEETQTLCNSGVFRTLIRAEYWAEKVAEYLEERGIESILLDGDDPSVLIKEAASEYPDDFACRTLN